MNLNPITAFKEKVKNDLMKFAKENFEKLKDQVMAMAESLDVDGDGVVDKQQIKQDVELLVDGSKVAMHGFKSGGALIVKGGSNLVKLGMAYYVKFGPKKPTEQVAALKQENNVA